MGNVLKVMSALDRSKVGSFLFLISIYFIPFSSTFAQTADQSYGSTQIPVFNSTIPYAFPTSGTGCGSFLSSSSGLSGAESLLRTALSLGKNNATASGESTASGGTATAACLAEGNFRKTSASLLAELDCFSKMIESGKMAMNELQKSITPVLEEAGKVVHQYEQDMEDRKAQQEEIKARFEEVNAERNKILKYVNGKGQASSSRDASNTKQAVTEFRLKQSQFKNSQNQYVLGLTMNCFLSEPVAGYQCIAGGPNVSASEYISCATVSSSQRDKNGNLISNDKLKERIESTMKSQMSSLSTNAPVLTEYSNDLATKNFKLNSLDAIDKYFIAQFKGMKPIRGNLPVDVAIRAEIKNRCYNKAKEQAAKELADPTKSSKISAASVELEKQGETLKQNMVDGIKAATQDYQDALTAVTGNPDLKLNTGPCIKGTLEAQADCAQQMDTLMSSLLNGVVSSTSSRALSSEALQLTGGAQPITTFTRDIIAPSEVSGSKRLSFTMKCNGLNACVTAYKNAGEQIGKFQQQLESGRKSYIKSANAAITSKVTQVAAVLSQRSKLISDQKASLTAMLSRLGVKGGLSIESDTGSADVNPGQGLYQNSQVSELIRGKISPPFFKGDDGINSAKDNIMAKQEELTKACSESITGLKEDKTIAKCTENYEKHEENYLECDNNNLKAVEDCKREVTTALNKLLRDRDNGIKDPCQSLENSVSSYLGSIVCDDKLDFSKLKELKNQCDAKKPEDDQTNSKIKKCIFDPNPLAKFPALNDGYKPASSVDCKELSTNIKKSIDESKKVRGGGVISGGLTGS